MTILANLLETLSKKTSLWKRPNLVGWDIWIKRWCHSAECWSPNSAVRNFCNNSPVRLVLFHWDNSRHRGLKRIPHEEVAELGFASRLICLLDTCFFPITTLSQVEWIFHCLGCLCYGTCRTNIDSVAHGQLVLPWRIPMYLNAFGLMWINARWWWVTCMSLMLSDCEDLIFYVWVLLWLSNICKRGSYNSFQRRTVGVAY